MAGVDTICEECEGKRFEASVLDHRLGGRDISEVLAMSVTEARLTGVAACVPLVRFLWISATS
jgi:excinuclease UvrABC ATPase subunit